MSTDATSADKTGTPRAPANVAPASAAATPAHSECQQGRRQLSLLTPSGPLTIGNYLGVLQDMSTADGGGLYGISDLHAMTMPHRPAELRERIATFQRLMLASGVDPARHILFRQSLVPEHTGMHYLLECLARVGELERMIQYKQKRREQPDTRMSLLSYPVLMAADILLYHADDVPVGTDQDQHVELARMLAQRFNRDYPLTDGGEVFTVPRATNPPVAARVMDLQQPDRKMSKSDPVGTGVLYLLDRPDVAARKIRRAVTDSQPGISYRPADRPGVANLLELGAACSGESIQQLIDAHCRPGAKSGLGALKATVADAVVSVLTPIQQSYAALDPHDVAATFAAGSEQAQQVAAPTLAQARQAIGLEAT